MVKHVLTARGHLMLLAFVGALGCSDDGGGGDTPDSAPPSADAAPQVDAPPTQIDAGALYDQEFTIQNDDGLAVLRLIAAPASETRILIEPDASYLPVEIRTVSIIPASVHAADLVINADSGGVPGSELARREFSVALGDLGAPYEIDIADLELRLGASFWVVIEYAASLGENTEVAYGTTSSTGKNFYYNFGYPLYPVNFDMWMRVGLATTYDGSMPTPGADRDACDSAADCASGYCTAGRCSISCAGGEPCGAERRCQDLMTGTAACVFTCTQSSTCPGGAFCLTDTTFIDPAGLCVQGGAYSNGVNCQYHYHTFCAGGHCTACDSDPSLCEDPGTCTNAP